MSKNAHTYRLTSAKKWCWLCLAYVLPEKLILLITLTCLISSNVHHQTKSYSASTGSHIRFSHYSLFFRAFVLYVYWIASSNYRTSRRVIIYSLFELFHFCWYILNINVVILSLFFTYFLIALLLLNSAIWKGPLCQQKMNGITDTTARYGERQWGKLGEAVREREKSY